MLKNLRLLMLMLTVALSLLAAFGAHASNRVQYLHISFPPSQIVMGEGRSVVHSSTSGLPVSYRVASSQDGITAGCSVTTDGVLTGINSAGICQLHVIQLGNSDWAFVEVVYNVSVIKRSQFVSAVNPNSYPNVLVGESINIAHTSTSGLPVGYDIGASTACSVTSEGILTGLNATGLCQLRVVQEGSSTYAPANSLIYNISVLQKSQTISFANAPALAVNSTAAVVASVSSGLPLEFSSLTVDTCTIINNIVSGIKAGNCTIAANQAGNVAFSPAATVTQNITVSAPVQPSASLSANTLTFSSQGSGTQSSPQIIILTNAGNGSLSAGNFTVTGDFTQTNNCNTNLGSGASCTINLVFSPTGSGNKTGSLSFSTNTSVNALVVSLIGVGVTAGQPVPVPAPDSIRLSLSNSWNLMGNSTSSPIDVASKLGDPNKVDAVWKWRAASNTWAFYSPTLPDGGAAYAASKGYDFLTAIAAGEGFWVNAKAAFAVDIPTGTPVNASIFQDKLDPNLNLLISGWNLISTGDGLTPAGFNQIVSVAPSVSGAGVKNIVSLWAWDKATSGWYFYSPELDAKGTLGNFNASKGYLDFAARVLDASMGFWVNKP